ncbi:MAG: hypothetical protein K2N94_03105 [Lachnospiraceae bacterium]|nr:hypothetical protein [Lachnospiraceae bacterium]
MNNLLYEANAMLANGGFEYAICGGYAVDLFLGRESRLHGDIDILAYWTERDKIILYMQSLGFEVYEMLGGGRAHHITDVADQKRVKRNIFCCKPDCELVSLVGTEEKGIFLIDFRHIGQTKLNFIEFLFNERTDTEFIYARNHAVRRTLEKAVLHYDNIPFLSPELCLLYKSTDTEREGYQQDYELASEAMSPEQREWLDDALGLTNPEGHKWRLSADRPRR